MRETPLSNSERTFVTDALKAGQRLDGRGTYDYRRVQLTFPGPLGLAEVQIGKSRAMAQVACDLVRPFPDRPSEGMIAFNIEMGPIASPAFEAGRPSDQSVEISRIIERGIRESRAIDTESLCVVSGVAVWSLRIDIHALDDGGNLLDATHLAAIAALCHFRRPEVSVVGGQASVYAEHERDPVPLAMHHVPLAVTIGFLEEGHLVIDASAKEERVLAGSLTVTMNAHKEICLMHKSGSVTLLPDQTMRCVKIAAVKVIEMNELVQSALKQSAERRADKTSGLPKLVTVTSTGSSMVPDVPRSVSVTENASSRREVIEADDSAMEVDDDNGEDKETIVTLGKGTATTTKTPKTKKGAASTPGKKGW
eukprot:Opistho-2@28470